jgi:hypothetical protein
MYKSFLFLHILGVMVMFAAVGITLTGMIGMVFAKETKILKVWSKVTVKMDEFLPFSVILILAPGLYLVISSWGWKVPWVNISLAALILMSLAGPIINLRRFKEILVTVNAETGDIPSAKLVEKVRDRVLWNTVSIMTMEVLGIIYLMTVKPGILGSLVTLVIGILLGLIISNIFLSKASKTEFSIEKSKTSNY